MSWPFADRIRGYMRMASYWLDLGRTFEQILDWARGSRHYYDVSEMEEALPEAARANYFRTFVGAHDPETTFQRQWGWAARGAWYAGYGRAPTAAELPWAYSRPSDTIGLAVLVTGRGIVTGREQRFQMTVNVPWTSSFGAVERAVREYVGEGSLPPYGSDYEALDASSIDVRLIGGALIERQSPTLTIS